MRNPLIPVVLCFVLLILLCELPFGLVSRCFDPARDSNHYAHHVAQQNWMRVRIAEMPVQHASTVHAVAEVLEISDSNGRVHPCNGKILLYLQRDSVATSPVAYGDLLLLLSSPKLPSAVDNPHQFDYRRHLRNKGILYTDYVTPDDYRRIGNDSRGLRALFASLRQQLVQIIRLSSLTPSQQGIAEALFLGWDDDLDEATTAHFRQAGIMHLLCVSGLHVGIVALLAGWALSFLSNRRRTRILKGVIVLLTIWSFVLLTGMAPGTMRAGLMFSLITVGQMAFSRPPTLNAIAASALILLVARPLLLFDIGFQLSYAAVTGIVILVPRFKALLPLPAAVDNWWQPAAFLVRKIHSLFFVSLAAQLATAPFILFYFHQFPLCFLIANMVVVPFAGLLLGSVIVMVAFAWWPWLFGIWGSVVSFELRITEGVTSAIASWPHATIEGIWFDGLMLAICLLLLCLIGTLVIRFRWRTLAAALATLLALTVYGLVQEHRCATQIHYDIYRLGNRTAIEFFAEHKSYLLCDSTVASSPQSIDYQTAGNLRFRQAHRTHVLKLDTTFKDDHLMVADRFVSFHGTTMRIVDRSNYRRRTAQQPHVNLLILRESPYITVAELQQQYLFDTLVIASQNSLRRRQSWIGQCDSLGIPYKDYR